MVGIWLKKGSLVKRQAAAFGILVAFTGSAGAGLDDIRLPPGFSIEVFTEEVPNARSLAQGERGTFFVGTRRDGRVYAVVPRDNDAPRVITIAADLNMPNGVAFHDGDLYVAEVTRISRYRDIESRLDNIPEPEVVNDSFPSETHHGWRYIDFGPDGKLYISIGAPCNICNREGFANISRLNADGSGKEIVASGIRNSVGFTWHPETGEMWFTDNGRDMLGDDLPPGELNHLTSVGSHFGFPFCHAGEISDPEFGDQGNCEDFTPRLRNSVRTWRRSASSFIRVACFRRSIADSCSSPNMDPGTARRRSATGSPWCEWATMARTDTKSLRMAGCRATRFRVVQWICWSSTTVRCWSATTNPVASTV